MKKLTALLIAALLLVSLAATGLAEWKPEKPITIMNYVKAGGGMDISTRKFVEIAARYTDATIIVDNKPGAGGLTAAEYILGQPADGYTVFASTIAYVDNVLGNEEDTETLIWGFEWIDNIMADPYAIIVPEDSPLTLDDIIADAKEKDGRQLWAGPAGAKNISAVQFWNAFGMEGLWNVYESGPDALLAVMSGQAVASVGNPGDVEGRALKNLVIATKEKLPKSPDVPNFADLGYPELDELSMWRGYAVKKGTPQEMITWWQDLCQQVTEDPDWVAFFADKSIAVHNLTTEAFTQQVKDDMESHLQIMKDSDLVDEDYNG